MKHLFVVRHAAYGGDDRISPDGRQQMLVLGDYIKTALGGSSAYLLSSTAPRALDSAEVLSLQLGLKEFERVPYLWSGADAPKDAWHCTHGCQKVMEIIDERKDKANGLVMVVHLELAQGFSDYVIHNPKFGDHQFDPFAVDVKKGQAVHIDFEQRKWRIAPI